MITEFFIAVALSTATVVDTPVIQNQTEFVQEILDQSSNPFLVSFNKIYNTINTRYNTEKEALRWSFQIYTHSTKRNIDPVMFAHLVRNESYGNPNAVSVANATGLTQIIPSYWAERFPECGPTNINDQNHTGLKNPVTNICYGTSVLNYYLWQTVVWKIFPLVLGIVRVVPVFDMQHALNMYSGFSGQYANQTSPYSFRIMEGTF